jgi:hypothetical protein
MVTDQPPDERNPIVEQIRSFVGPVKRWEVPDVNAAISLAGEFQRSGAYDLFRGQARLWPVYSGAVRLEMETGKSHVKIFKHFARRKRSRSSRFSRFARQYYVHAAAYIP